MTEMKTSIQGLLANADIAKDGKIATSELMKVCVHLGMAEDEVSVMFAEIDKDASEITITAFMDWVFGGDEPAPAEEAKAEEEEEEEDDVEDELDEPPPPPKSGGARSSVSAEAYGTWNVKKAFEPPVFEKTDEQKKRINGTLAGSFLFQSVDPKDLDTLLGAVEECKVEQGTRVINKGDDGDFMCIIESGTFDCLVPVDGEEKSVKTCEPGDVFGELALMYNCPRAASVVATTEGTYWKLGRETFNYIVRDAAQKKREKYESILKSVPLLEKMTDWEKSQIADALKEEMVEDGKVIVSEGDQGDTFYIVADGTAEASKKDEGSVMSYKAGDYFGELALINDAPRAATVTSGGCKVLMLDRKSFMRLLGSVDELGKNTYQTHSKVI